VIRALAFALALAPAGAVAWETAPTRLTSGAVHTIFVDNDTQSFLSGQPIALSELIQMVDNEAQYWSINGRAGVALAASPSVTYAPTLPPCTPFVNCTYVNDATCSVLHRPRAWFEDSAQRSYTFCEGPTTSECDIVLMRATPWVALSDGPDATGLEGAPGLRRTLGQEMGRMLGLGYLVTPSICSATGESPLMCRRGPLSYGPRWIHAAPDDVQGARARHGTVNRFVGVMRGDVGVGGAISWDEDALDTGFQTVTRPRVSCRPDPGPTECVVVTTDGDDNVTLRPLFVRPTGVWSPSATVTMPDAVTRIEPDVAVGPNHSVAVFANDAGVVRATILDRATLATRTMDLPSAVTREPPRISWSRALWRFVVAWTTPRGSLTVSVSADSIATGFLSPATVTTARAAYGAFDLSCPTHTDGVPCRVVFQDWVDDPATPIHDGRPVQLANRQMRQWACLFSLSTDGTLTGSPECGATDVLGTMAVSLSDYRQPTAPPGVPVGPGWLLVSSQRQPLVNANTRTSIDFAATGIPFRSLLVDQIRTFDTPFQVASPPPFSLFGGVSCDYVETLRRFLCVQMKESVRF
jgi:hypothetical protein